MKLSVSAYPLNIFSFVNRILGYVLQPQRVQTITTISQSDMQLS